MSNYTKSTNFATKDNLTPGDPLKIVRGTEIDTEYNNIATAIATKTDNASAAITGGSITGITDLAVADGGTGASTAAGGLNNLLPSQTGNANKYLQTDGTNATWDAVSLSTADITGTLPVANGGTGVTSSTGTGSVVLSNSPTLVTPALGTPASATLTNATGLPISTGVSGLGTDVATFLATPSSANLRSALTDETGTGSAVFATSPALVTPDLGTPSAATLTNATGLPISTGVSGLGTGVATALAVNVGLSGAPLVNGGVLGTPSSGTVTNLTGTASININGTVGATTATTGAFTTLAASSNLTLSGGTANGVTFLNGSKVLTSGSALTFDGSALTVDAHVNVNGGDIRFDDDRFVYSYSGGSVGQYRAGFYLDGAGTNIRHYINNAEQMRLTSTGLGIGTSSPIFLTDILSGTANTGANVNNPSQLSVTGANKTLTGGGATVFVNSNSNTAIDTGGSIALSGRNTTSSTNSVVWGVIKGAKENSTSTNTAGYLAFATSNHAAGALVEAVRIDSSGNVGIGTSSPSAKLDVAGSAYVRGDSTDATFTSAGQLAIKRSTSDPVLSFHANAGSQIGNIQMQANGTCSITVAVAQPLAFSTNGSERARIDSSGNLLVGTTTTNPHSTGTYGSQLSVGGALIGVNNSHAIIAARWNGDGEVIRLQRDNTDVGSIDVTTTATSYNTSSDYRLKENIAPMTGALATVAQLKPVTYTWKVNGTSSQGFIAHELQAVVPDCVTGEKDAVDADGNPKYQGIDTSFLVATLAAAIQELKAEFDAYKASHP